MPLTITNFTGDGVGSDAIHCSIEVPDSGTSYVVTGTVTPKGGSAVSMTGSPLTAPSPPGSGSIYWIIQVNTTTGALSIKQNGVGPAPTPDAGNDTIFTQTLPTGTTDPMLVTSDLTPDTY